MSKPKAHPGSNSATEAKLLRAKIASRKGMVARAVETRSKLAARIDVAEGEIRRSQARLREMGFVVKS